MKFKIGDRVRVILDDIEYGDKCSHKLEIGTEATISGIADGNYPYELFDEPNDIDISVAEHEIELVHKLGSELEEHF